MEWCGMHEDKMPRAQSGTQAGQQQLQKPGSRKGGKETVGLRSHPWHPRVEKTDWAKRQAEIRDKKRAHTHRVVGQHTHTEVFKGIPSEH